MLIKNYKVMNCLDIFHCPYLYLKLCFGDRTQSMSSGTFGHSQQS